MHRIAFLEIAFLTWRSQHSDDAWAFSRRRDWVAAVAAAACGGLPAGAGWDGGLASGLKPVHRPSAKVGSWYPPGEAAAWCAKGALKAPAFSPLHSMTRPDERCRVSAPHR